MSVLTVREITGVNWVIQTSRASPGFSMSVIRHSQEGHVSIFYLLVDLSLASEGCQF